MQARFRCPKCDQTSSVSFDGQTAALRCAGCDHAIDVPAGSVEDGGIRRCLVCHSDELYVRKDFSQRLGLSIIVAGFAASCVTWYFYMKYATFGVLLLTALVDVVLYLLVGNVLQCYRCHSEYRGVSGLEQHGPFDLEIHERYRQQAARMAQAQRSSDSEARV